MTESEEKKASDSQGSQTIRIEMPVAAFESMRRMMSEFCSPVTTQSSCCEMPQEACCPQAGDSRNKEFTFVIKRKV